MGQDRVVSEGAALTYYVRRMLLKCSVSGDWASLIIVWKHTFITLFTGQSGSYFTQGLSVWSLHIFSASAWVLFGYSSFLPQSKEMQKTQVNYLNYLSVGVKRISDHRQWMDGSYFNATVFSGFPSYILMRKWDGEREGEKEKARAQGKNCPSTVMCMSVTYSSDTDFKTIVKHWYDVYMTVYRWFSGLFLSIRELRM